MPTVITNAHSTRSYAPLADENSPVASPTVSINGTVVYSKRLTPPGSSSNSEDDHKNGSSLMDSDETLPGARRNKSRGHFAVEDDDSGSLKGKNRAWGERATDYVEDDAAYPPVNAVEEEEKRVQAVRALVLPDASADHCAELGQIRSKRDGSAKGCADVTLSAFPCRLAPAVGKLVHLVIVGYTATVRHWRVGEEDGCRWQGKRRPRRHRGEPWPVRVVQCTNQTLAFVRLVVIKRTDIHKPLRQSNPVAVGFTNVAHDARLEPVRRPSNGQRASGGAHRCVVEQRRGFWIRWLRVARR